MIAFGMRIIIAFWFLALWLIPIAGIIGFRICFALVKLLCKGLCRLIRRKQNSVKGYEVRYYE